jgi:hypothetical protein
MRGIAVLAGLGLASTLVVASSAQAALAFRFNRASAQPGAYVVAFEPGWSSAPTGVIVYLVPTKLPGITPDPAGGYILPKPPAQGAIRLGRPWLTTSRRLSIRFRVPHVQPGDYTTAFWCSTCAKHGDFFASAPWGAAWTRTAGAVLRITH